MGQLYWDELQRDQVHQPDIYEREHGKRRFVGREHYTPPFFNFVTKVQLERIKQFFVKKKKHVVKFKHHRMEALCIILFE